MTQLVRLVAIVALSGSLAATATPIPLAHADASAVKLSKRYFALGEKLFTLGRFDAALEQYEKAYEANPLPAFLFNIGQCHRNLGHYQQAAFSFRTYLRESPNAEQRESVEALIVELEEKQREAEDREHQPGTVFSPSQASVAPPAAKRTPPIYTRWWFWGGVAAVAGASAGTYLLLRSDGVPTTDLGNVVFH